jgi:hypothetical protein
MQAAARWAPDSLRVSPHQPRAYDAAMSAPSISDILRELPVLAEHPELVPVAAGLFEYTNVLLDDEDNLTRVGNLTGEAKARLRARALELLGMDEGSAL